MRVTSVADPDGALIERSVEGQPDAFVAVVERHELAVHGFLARRAGQQAADDLLGEVWLRAFASRAAYDVRYSDARPWLYGIARNVLRAHWRDSAALAASQPPCPPDDPWDDVINRIDSAAEARALVSALRALPPAEREVLLLVAWEQLTPAEAAVVVGVPQGTARSRLHRARTALQLVLTGNLDDGREEER